MIVMLMWFGGGGFWGSEVKRQNTKGTNRIKKCQNSGKSPKEERGQHKKIKKSKIRNFDFLI